MCRKRMDEVSRDNVNFYAWAGISVTLTRTITRCLA